MGNCFEKIKSFILYLETSQNMERNIDSKRLTIRNVGNKFQAKKRKEKKLTNT